MCQSPCVTAVDGHVVVALSGCVEQRRLLLGRDETMTDAAEERSPSELIDGRIAALRDWRGETLARVRGLIRAAVPDVEETWKWRGVPVWEKDGILCTGETYKAVVKLTFANGAALEDPARLFNASLKGNVRRAIDLREGEPLDEGAFKALVAAAAAFNAARAAGRRKARR